MPTTVAALQAVLSADTGPFDKAMDRSESRTKSLAKTMRKAGLAGASLSSVNFSFRARNIAWLRAARISRSTPSLDSMWGSPLAANDRSRGESSRVPA